jgi:pimeloyl-ACP methyl ester carboxylesterase
MEALGFSSRGDGTRLSGWLIPAEADRAVILVHGVDSDAWSGAAPDLARAYRSAGFSVLLFDLRAHGRSGGLRITLGRREREDIGAAVDLLLHKGIPPGSSPSGSSDPASRRPARCFATSTWLAWRRSAPLHGSRIGPFC